MLTLEQIAALKADHLFVYRGKPGTPSYRVVWMEDGTGFVDKRERLMHAHPSDESGEDWQQAEKDFNPADYELHSVGSAYGGHFHNINCLDDEVVVCTKVVKFTNPRPPLPKSRSLPHYVVFRHQEPLTDEEACEQAIDLVLALGAGFTEANAHPILVI